MHRLRVGAPSPAMLVALIALFVALGGTGYAATQLTDHPAAAAKKKHKKKHSDQAQDIALIKKQAAKLKGPKGDKGTTGAGGAAGATGATGAAGSGRAYAFVDPGSCTGTPGTCSFIKAKGLTSVRRNLLGVYCITPGAGINPSTDVSMAGVDFRNSSSPEGNGSAMTDATNAGCNAGEFEIVTERWANPGNSATSNTVAFWFAVP